MPMSALPNPPLTLHRFTRDEYERMIDAGVFAPGTRLELMDGEIINMTPQKSLHATAVRLVEDTLRRAFANQKVDIRTQFPFALTDVSEPEPDIAVVPGTARDYRDAHPSVALLLVEVADSTVDYDRTRKLPAYTRAGIPEFWLLDLTRATLEVYRQPAGDCYVERLLLKAGEWITPLAATAADIAVDELLP